MRSGRDLHELCILARVQEAHFEAALTADCLVVGVPGVRCGDHSHSLGLVEQSEILAVVEVKCHIGVLVKRGHCRELAILVKDVGELVGVPERAKRWLAVELRVSVRLGIRV